MIAIHAMVYKFQKRAWWQMCSLAEQIPWEGNPVPEFKYCISTHCADPFAPDLQRAAAKLPYDVSSQYWNEDLFGERGHVRTRNLREETAEFLLFVDADMVYEPHWLAKVGVAAAKHRGEHKVLAAPRQSMAFEDGYKIADKVSNDYSVITDTWGYTNTYKKWWSAHGRISGAGFFQLVHLPTLREYLQKTWGDICYVGKEWHRDTNILKASVNKMRSDRNFRLNAGGILEAPQLGEALHINHYRHSDPQWPTIPQH